MRRRSATTVMAVALAAAVLSVQAQESTRPADRAGQTADRQTTNTAPTDTRTFINNMAIAGMAEVQLGKLASERGMSADVKQFGQMMVTDHTKANDELKQIAAKLNVPLPTELDTKHKALADRLSKLQGAEFDREYAMAMVSGHEEVAATLRARSQSNRSTSAQPSTTGRQTGSATSTAVGTAGSPANEDTVTQWAAKTLPTVQQHLERARGLQKSSK